MKIKYVIMTTISSTMRNFGIPLAVAMKNKGWKPVIVCNMDDEFYHEYSSQYECINLDIVRGFHLINMLKTISKLVKLFRSSHIDIIQYGTENAAFCGAIAAKIAHIPVRIYEHWGARYVGYTGFLRFVSKVIEKTAAKCSTDIRQVSFLNMEMCIRDRIYPRRKVKVLGAGGTVGVDIKKFDLNKKQSCRNVVRRKYNLPDDAFVFGFVGRIQTSKGVNELIKSYKNIYNTNKNVYLMLVGNIDNESPIDEATIMWAQNCKNVFFVGQVNDVEKYISAFDVMVHPTYREGFGMVLQEAGALRVSIITTKVFGPSEFINNGVNGILVEPRNITELTNAMRLLYNDDELRDRIAQAVYEHTINEFERSVMVERVINDRVVLLKERGEYNVETDFTNL